MKAVAIFFALVMSLQVVSGATRDGDVWTLSQDEYLGLIDNQQIRNYNYTYNTITQNIDPSNCSVMVEGKDYLISHWKNISLDREDEVVRLEERINASNSYYRNLSNQCINYVSYDAETEEGRQAIQEYVSNHSGELFFMFIGDSKKEYIEVPQIREIEIPSASNEKLRASNEGLRASNERLRSILIVTSALAAMLMVGLVLMFRRIGELNINLGLLDVPEEPIDDSEPSPELRVPLFDRLWLAVSAFLHNLRYGRGFNIRIKKRRQK